MSIDIDGLERKIEEQFLDGDESQSLISEIRRLREEVRVKNYALDEAMSQLDLLPNYWNRESLCMAYNACRAALAAGREK